MYLWLLQILSSANRHPLHTTHVHTPSLAPPSFPHHAASSYVALFFPSALGALYDLYNNNGLAAVHVLTHFVSMQSKTL